MNQETNQQSDSNEVRFNVSCDADNKISIQVDGIKHSIIAVLISAAMKSDDVKSILLATATIIKDHSDELNQIDNLN